MKRGLLFLAIFLLTITTVSALELKHEVVQGEALPGGRVSYILEFNNNEEISLSIKLKTADLNWVLDQEGYSFTLSPGEARDVTVSFLPLAENRIRPGSYGVTLFADTQTTRLERILPAIVLRYDDVLDAGFSPDARIDPRRGAIIRLFVENKKQVDLENIDLSLSSDHFKFTRTLSLGKKESTVLEFPVSIDSDTVRGDYSANLFISMSNNVFVDEQLTYSVEEYEDLKEIITPSSGFLLAGETIQKKNEGNTPVFDTVARQFSWLSYKFTDFEVYEPTKVTKTEDGFLVQWDINVPPGEEATISYITNYRLLAVIVLIVIAALVVWYIFRKRNVVSVSKRVLAMHTDAGNVRVIKIVLNLRNRGNLPVHNVRLVDKVPSVIKAPTQYGMIKPNHVKAAPEGTVMVWDFSTLRPREEKVISYRLEGKIQVLGRLSLPPAIGKYVLFGRAVTAISSRVSLREKK